MGTTRKDAQARSNRAMTLSSIAVSIAITVAALFIVALLQPLAPVLRQLLPPVPLFSQVLFVLRREILPPLIVAQNSIFLSGRKIAPIIASRRHLAGRQQQKHTQTPSYHLSLFHDLFPAFDSKPLIQSERSRSPACCQ